jgi:TPR repeat protein
LDKNSQFQDNGNISRSPLKGIGGRFRFMKWNRTREMGDTLVPVLSVRSSEELTMIGKQSALSIALLFAGTICVAQRADTSVTEVLQSFPPNDTAIREAQAAYENGDYNAAFSKFQTLANQHNQMAQYVVGVMYDNGYGVPEKDAEAVRWYTLSAGQGYALAQDMFGVLNYYGGDGFTKNYSEAVRWFRLAAAQGLASAQRNLGSMYSFGDGVPQDFKESMRLFQLAASQGDATAIFDIGNMYSSGQGTPLDMASALNWYIRAAELGKAEAQYNVGNIYATGKGIPRDYAKAFQWFSKGAEQGNVLSLYYVGSMQIEGNGTALNHVAAYEYLSLAAERGNDRAGAELIFLKAKMSPDEISKAVALAGGWVPKKKRDLPW